MQRDAATVCNFTVYDAIIFVSLELPDKWSVSSRNPRTSQTETVSTYETVIRLAQTSLRVWVWGEAAPGQRQYPRIR